MNINGVSGSNPYGQTPNTGITDQPNALAKEQNPNTSTDTVKENTGNYSNQAFEVNITDQARQVLQTEQREMETKPDQDPLKTVNETQTNNQGPTKIIDLVA